MSSSDAEGEPQMDLSTGAALAKVGAEAVGDSRKLLVRILGPTADAVGTFLASWVEIRARNALRVAEAADKRRAGLNQSETGNVPVRIAMRIFDEAAYLDERDHVVVDYLGGLLASANIAGSGAGTANSYAALISRMATDHLRVHYSVYRNFHALYRNRDFNVYDQDELDSLGVFVRTRIFWKRWEMARERSPTIPVAYLIFLAPYIG